MESDRQQADLGPVESADLNGDTAPEPRQPKKRFVGRRAAAERAAAKGQTDGGIEDSNAVQGAAYIRCSLYLCGITNTRHSRGASADRTRPEPSPSRDPSG